MTPARAGVAPADNPARPHGSHPVIHADRMEPGFEGPSPLYSDRSWPLRSLGHSPSQQPVTVRWHGWPCLPETFKHMAYLVINEPTPDVLLESAGAGAVEWPSAGSIRTLLTDWRHFATWLAERDVQALADVTEGQLTHYMSLVIARDTPTTQRRRLRSITRLWALSTRVEAADRLLTPPWESEDLHFEGASNENATAVVHPDVMAPLLRWSLIFVQQAAADILAMTSFVRDGADRFPPVKTRQGCRNARTILDEYAQGERPLPGHISAANTVVVSKYLALVHGGCHPKDIGFEHSRMRPPHPVEQDVSVPLPLPLPVTGLIDGTAWAPSLDYRRLRDYQFALTGACLTVIAYLTGMRPQEVMTLRKGCATSTLVDGRHQYVIHGRRFKRVQREGRQDPNGEARSWVTIRPAVEAVHVLEQLHPGPYLVPVPRTHSRALDPGGATQRIARLIQVANELTASATLPASYRIPEDPSGEISLRRFRRTLAWHIRRLPNGSVALAVQYGHLSLRHGEGYAGLKVAGLEALMDHEDATAVVETLSELAGAVEHGEGMSGPAVERAQAATAKAAPFRGAFLSERELKVIKTDPDLQVYDNPNSLLLCVYDASQALCGGGSTPNLNACREGCTNRVWTDSQVERLARRASELRAEAANPLTPEPMALRLVRIADNYDKTIQRHSRERIVSEST
jgi:hypothetical protein